mgnify:CR=1 FL=1
MKELVLAGVCACVSSLCGAAAVPVQHSLSNYHTTVVASDAGGGQTLYSATLTYSGAVLILR